MSTPLRSLVGSEPLCGASGREPERERSMHLYTHLYLPLLLSACIVTAGYVVAWLLDGGGIDPGQPNARM
jgi:hypothetical protein